jgi:hypothetical protein
LENDEAHAKAQRKNEGALRASAIQSFAVFRFFFAPLRETFFS